LYIGYVKTPSTHVIFRVVEMSTELFSVQLNVSVMNWRKSTPSSDRKSMLKSSHITMGRSYNFNMLFSLIEHGSRYRSKNSILSLKVVPFDRYMDTCATCATQVDGFHFTDVCDEQGVLKTNLRNSSESISTTCVHSDG
jgi:hypothetical protein